MDTTHWVTEQWLRAHSTNGQNGWTAAQLRVLGVTWPPAKGWMRRLAGSGITGVQRETFEELGAQYRFTQTAKEQARHARRVSSLRFTDADRLAEKAEGGDLV